MNSQAFLSISGEFYFLNRNRMQANVNPLTAGSNTTQRHDVIYTGGHYQRAWKQTKSKTLNKLPHRKIILKDGQDKLKEEHTSGKKIFCLKNFSATTRAKSSISSPTPSRRIFIFLFFSEIYKYSWRLYLAHSVQKENTASSFASSDGFRREDEGMVKLRFCPNSNDLLYPKEDRERQS